MEKKIKIGLICLLFTGVLVSVYIITQFLQTQETLKCEILDLEYCEKDDDCICEQMRGCFMGNKDYYENCVNESIKSSWMCLDMCTQELCKCNNKKCDCGHDFA